MGAYVLIERMTWAAQDNRRGLEVLVEGDPALRTAYISSLVGSRRRHGVARLAVVGAGTGRRRGLQPGWGAGVYAGNRQRCRRPTFADVTRPIPDDDQPPLWLDGCARTRNVLSRLLHTMA